MNKKILALSSALIASSLAVAQTEETRAPRGPNVGAGASSCNIGPFPQLGKAGWYNQLCQTMPDTEKCLALIKRNMNADGTIHPAIHDKERSAFCMQVLSKALTGN